METKAHYVAVGAFVVACALGMLIALLWLAGAQYRQEFAYYHTYFTGAVTGLGTGTPVRYNGIEVGHVSKLDFDPDNPKKVIVTLEVSPALGIHDDSVATIASEGLTGGTYVEIDGGSKETPLLQYVRGKDYPVIRSKESAFQELEESAPQLFAKINHIADSLNNVLSADNVKAISQTLDHIRNMTALLERHSGDLDKTIHNIATGTTALNGDLADLHNVLLSAGQTTMKLNHVVDGVSAQLDTAQVGQLISQTRELEQSLTDLSNKIDRQPTSFLFGDRRKGYTPP